MDFVHSNDKGSTLVLLSIEIPHCLSGQLTHFGNGDHGHFDTFLKIQKKGCLKIIDAKFEKHLFAHFFLKLL